MNDQLSRAALQITNAIGCLRDALHDASAVESIVILPLIKRATELQFHISHFATALAETEKGKS